jgi:hypothetical protein
MTTSSLILAGNRSLLGTSKGGLQALEKAFRLETLYLRCFPALKCKN